MRKLLAAGAMLLMSGTAFAAGPVEETFQIRTAADLAALCSASGSDRNSIAALHFCHGYVVGAYQFYREVANAGAISPLFCTPDPVPTRDAVVAGFVGWTKTQPSVQRWQASDALFQYLSETYPCPK